MSRGTRQKVSTLLRNVESQDEAMEAMLLNNLDGYIPKKRMAVVADKTTLLAFRQIIKEDAKKRPEKYRQIIDKIDLILYDPDDEENK